MCLYTKQKKPRIATEDIYVYKVLRVTRTTSSAAIRSSIRGSIWRLNRLRRATMRAFPSWLWRGIAFRIEAGLHAYTVSKTAIHRSDSYSTFVFVAKIPKSAKYFIGVNDDIVANKMVVLDRNHPESLKRLSISKLVPLSYW